MPRSPSPDGRVRLSLTAGSPLAELFLVDHAFSLVDRSIGDLDCTVEPGVYKVKAKLGDAMAERVVVLDRDQAIDLSGELPVGSAAPIAGMARAREQDRHAAASRSLDVDARDGAGARVFLMARARSDDGASVRAPELTLRRPDGTVVAQPDASEAGDAVRTMSLEVTPGPFFLRWHDSSGVTAEQCVYGVRGWQTQIFVLDEASEPTGIGSTRVSILMGRKGFDPEDDGLALTEHARTALADERRVAADFVNQALAARSHVNPMLDLMRAHLMLVARNAIRGTDDAPPVGDGGAGRLRAPVAFEQSRFDEVVAVLRDALGADHPDVVALSTQTSDAALGHLAPVATPPMLWRSWVLLIEASNALPALVPVSTWQRTVKLLPLRPFLLWAPQGKASEVAERWTTSLSRALATAKREPEPDSSGGEGPLSSVLSDGAAEAAEAGDSGVEASDSTRQRVSRELLAPRAAVDEVAAAPKS